jgi:hypothetical protein
MNTYSFQTELRYNGNRISSFAVRDDGNISGGLGDELVDVGTWKSPPHVALANMTLEPRVLEAFSRRYGIFGEVKVDYSNRLRKLSAEGPRRLLPGEMEETPSELLNVHGASLVDQNFTTTISEFAEGQTLLRLAWLGDRGMLKLMMQAIKGGDYQVIPPGEARNDQTILATRDLRRYLCFLFIIDYTSGRARKCANPGCAATPYFIRQRKDQEYCGHSCAVEATNAKRMPKKRGKK